VRSWIDIKIEEWRSWKKEWLRATIVPPHIQVGKVLEHCNGDIDRARRLIEYEQRQDALMDFQPADPYWINVERVLLENIVHEIIIGD